MEQIRWKLKQLQTNYASKSENLVLQDSESTNSGTPHLRAQIIFYDLSGKVLLPLADLCSHRDGT